MFNSLNFIYRIVGIANKTANRMICKDLKSFLFLHVVHIVFPKDFSRQGLKCQSFKVLDERYGKGALKNNLISY